MQVYKVTYINKQILSCKPVKGKVMDGSFFYEYYNDILVHALIKADNAEEAFKEGEHILHKFMKQRQTHINYD